MGAETVMEGNGKIVAIKNMVCRRCILTVENVFRCNGIEPLAP